MNQTIRTARRLRGTVRPPGDKSIAHRALILSAIARGHAEIFHLPSGQDVRSTIGCLQALSVRIEQEGERALVYGKGLHGLGAPQGELDAGNSGTTMRLLSGILAGQPFQATLTGDASLQKRDMKRIVEPLTEMGASVASRNGLAPLTIRGGLLRPIRYTLPVASAQVKSCLLLAGLYVPGKTTVVEPSPTRDHTERMFGYLDVPVMKHGAEVTVEGVSEPKAKPIVVPGDFSSAAFFLAAALLVPDSEIRLIGVGINPTRTRFLHVLGRMGGSVALENQAGDDFEPRADLVARSSRLKAVEVSGSEIPLILDEIPVLAVLATQAEGTTVIRDARELRVKESDRIRSTVENIRNLGGDAEELPDGMMIRGPSRLRGASLPSFGDHRIAMAFAVAGLVAEGEAVLEGVEWVDVSFPGFFRILESISLT